VNCICFRSLVGLEMFPHLEEVILDSNGLTDLVIESLPQLRRVRSLSLNKNKIFFDVYQCTIATSDVSCPVKLLHNRSIAFRSHIV